MLFNSFEYIIFLAAAVCLYWVMPRQAKAIFLVAASYFFYTYTIKAYGLLLLLLTLANYLVGLALQATNGEKAKRLVLIGGITLNLGILALFKYTNFILDSINVVLDSINVSAKHGCGISDLPIILPLGISFFVFEFIHYLTDVFKGSAAIRNPVRFALFASFFPSQIAGPIKRYQDFDSQLDPLPRLDTEKLHRGLWLIAQGLYKKVALGDNLARIVRAGFDNPGLMGTTEGWICALAFTFQIYFDFSGYTDIGRGSAMLFGFSLPENFNLPYIASSLRDFWRRWHISLSTWLRDYLYIPLGGSKSEGFRTFANLMITMLLGGLWHGASWTFVIWGAFHGLGLAVNRRWEQSIERSARLKRIAASLPLRCAAYGLTFLTVVLGWVIFRAKDLPEATGVYSAMFSLRASSSECTVLDFAVNSPLPAAISIYLILQSTVLIWKHSHDLNAPLPGSMFKLARATPPYAIANALAFVAVLILTLSLSPAELQPFIYFQF
ncbi:MAG TPA: MBOAT family protein [Candidatus Obscuribacterales bacterium]